MCGSEDTGHRICAVCVNRCEVTRQGVRGCVGMDTKGTMDVRCCVGMVTKGAMGVRGCVGMVTKGVMGVSECVGAECVRGWVCG